MLKEYDYPKGSFRARCTKVVDGDTVDLYVDTGFHTFRQERFRLAGIDTPELRDRDPNKRELAKEAKAYVIDALDPAGELKWPLRIETEKVPDSFGRYICRIFYWEGDESSGKEVCLNDKLVEDGHAIYKSY